jgi:hypothetical protein
MKEDPLPEVHSAQGFKLMPVDPEYERTFRVVSGSAILLQFEYAWVIRLLRNPAV